MRLTYTVLRAALFVLLIAAIGRPISGCTKNPFLPHNNDSTDTLRIPVHHDSAKFDAHFDLWIYNTSNVYNDTFADHADMVIFVVDGVVKIPTDSIFNWEPIVYPSSGSEGSWSATWIPDNIGLINIVGASGTVLYDDTTVVMTLNQTGTVTPKWSISFMGGAPTTAGGVSTPGWPPAFTFSLQQISQYPIKLDQQGSTWEVWMYKDY